MKHYLINNEIRAIEEGQEFLVQSDWVLLSDEELHARLNPPKTEEQIAEEAKVSAKLYLAETDWIKSKYIEVVLLKGEMTKANFIAKYQAELDAMGVARGTLNV